MSCPLRDPISRLASCSLSPPASTAAWRSLIVPGSAASSSRTTSAELCSAPGGEKRDPQLPILNDTGWRTRHDAFCRDVPVPMVCIGMRPSGSTDRGEEGTSPCSYREPRLKSMSPIENGRDWSAVGFSCLMRKTVFNSSTAFSFWPRAR